LGLLSLFGIGMLVAALASTSASAQGLSMLVYFPLLFFVGVYFPLEGMSGPLRTLADLLPSGAVVAGLSAAMRGTALEARDLLVMAAYAAVLTFLAVRTFRWEWRAWPRARATRSGRPGRCTSRTTAPTPPSASARCSRLSTAARATRG